MMLERGGMIKPDSQDCLPYNNNIMNIKTCECLKCHWNDLKHVNLNYSQIN